MAIQSGIDAVPIVIEQPSGLSPGLTGWLVTANITLNLNSAPNEATITFANESGKYALSDSQMNKLLGLTIGSGTFKGYVKNLEIQSSENGRVAQVVLQDERSNLANYRLTTASSSLDASGFFYQEGALLDNASSIGAIPSLKLPQVSYATVQDYNIIHVLPSVPIGNVSNKLQQTALREADIVLQHGATYGEIYDAINNSSKPYYAQLSGILPTPTEVALKMKISQVPLDATDIEETAAGNVQTEAILTLIDGSGDNKIRHRFDTETHLDEALDSIFNDLGVDWYWNATTRQIDLIPRDTSLALTDENLPGDFGRVRISTSVGKVATDDARVAIILGARRTGLLGNPLALTNTVGNWRIFSLDSDLKIRGSFIDPYQSAGDTSFSLSNQNAYPYWHYTRVRYYLPGTGQTIQSLSGTQFLRDFLLRPVFPLQGYENSTVNNVNVSEESLISYDRLVNYWGLPSTKIRYAKATTELPATNPMRKLIEEASGWPGGASGAWFEYCPSDLELSAALNSKADWQLVVGARTPVTGLFDSTAIDITTVEIDDSRLANLFIDELPTFRLGQNCVTQSVGTFADKTITATGSFIQISNGTTDRVPIWHGYSAGETLRKTLAVNTNYFKGVDLTEHVPVSDAWSNLDPQLIDTYFGSRPGSDAIFGRYIPIPTIRITGYRALVDDPPVVDVELAHDGRGAIVLDEDANVYALSTSFPQFTYPNNATLPTNELFTGTITGYFEQSVLYQALTKTNPDGSITTGYAFGPQFNEKAKKVKRFVGATTEEDGYYMLCESGSVFGFGGAPNLGSFNDYVFNGTSSVSEFNPLHAVSIAPLFAKVEKLGLPIFSTGAGYAVIFSNGAIKVTGAIDFGLTGVGLAFDAASTMMSNAVSNFGESIVDIEPSLNSRVKAWYEVDDTATFETYVFSLWWDQNPSDDDIDGSYSVQIAGLEAGTKDRGLEWSLNPSLRARVGSQWKRMERESTRLEPISLNIEQLAGLTTTSLISGIPHDHFDATTGAFPWDPSKRWKAQLIPLTNITTTRKTSTDLQGGSHEVSAEPFSFVFKPNDSERIDGAYIFAENPDWCITAEANDSFWAAANVFDDGDYAWQGGLKGDLLLVTRDPTKDTDDDNYNVLLADMQSYNPALYKASGDYGFYVLSTSGGFPIVRGFGTAYRMVDQHEGTGITGQFLKAVYANPAQDSSAGERKSTHVLKVEDDSDLISAFANGTRRIVDLAVPFFGANPRPVLPGPSTLVKENQYNLTRAQETNNFYETIELNISSIYVDTEGRALLSVADLTDFPKSGLITVISTDIENERPFRNRRMMTLGYSGIIDETSGPEFLGRLILSTTTDSDNKHPGFPYGYFTGVSVDIQSKYSDEWLLENVILQGHGAMPDPVLGLIPEAFPITNDLIVDFVGGSGTVGSTVIGTSTANAIKFFSGNEIVVNWQKSLTTEGVETSGVWVIDNSGRIYTVPTFENYHNVKLIDPTVGTIYSEANNWITGEPRSKYDGLIPSYLFQSSFDYKGDTQVTIKEALKTLKRVLTQGQPIDIDWADWSNYNLARNEYETLIFWNNVIADSTSIPSVIDVDLYENWDVKVTRQQVSDLITWLVTAALGNNFPNPFTTTAPQDVDGVALSTNPTDTIIREDFQCAILWNLIAEDLIDHNATFVAEFPEINYTPYWQDLTSSAGILDGVDSGGTIDNNEERRRYLTAQVMAHRQWWAKPDDQFGVYNTQETNLDQSIVLFGEGAFYDFPGVENISTFRSSTNTTSGLVHELVALTATKYSGLPLFGHEHEDSVFDPAGMAEMAAGPGCDMMRSNLEDQQVVAFTPTFGGTDLDANRFDEFGRLTTTSSGHILFTNKGEGYRTILPMTSEGLPLSSPLGLSGVYVQNSGNVWILGNNTPEVGQFTSVDIQDLNGLLDVDLNIFLYSDTLERASFVDQWWRSVESIATEFYAKSYVVPRGLFQSGQRLALTNSAFVDLNIEGERIPDYFKTVGLGPTLHTTKLAAAAPFVSTQDAMIGPHALINRAGGVIYGLSTNEPPSNYGTFYDGLAFDIVPITTSEVGGLSINNPQQSYQSIVLANPSAGVVWDPGTIKIDFEKQHFDGEARFYLFNRILFASKTGYAIVSGVDLRSTNWPEGIEIDITGIQIVPPSGFSNYGARQFESLGLLKVPVPPSGIYFGIPVMEQIRYGPFIAGETGLLTGGATAKGQITYEVDETLAPQNFPIDEGEWNKVQKSRIARMIRHGISKARGSVSQLATNDTAEVEVWGLPEVTFEDFVSRRVDNVNIRVDSQGPRTTYSLRSKDRIYAKETTRIERRQREMLNQINSVRQIYSTNAIDQFSVQIGSSTRQNYGVVNRQLGMRPVTSYSFDSDTWHEIERK